MAFQLVRCSQSLVDGNCEELMKTMGAFRGGKPSVRESGPKYFQLSSLKAHWICFFLLKLITLII